MALRKRHSKLWNYFEELKPSLVKCTTCKKEIQIPHRSSLVSIFRAHLSIKHGIFLNNDTFTLPDDLRQYYSELSGYKAKCKDCDRTLSFLSSMEHLRKHLRRHSTRIQSRDETVIMAPTRKRSKLWNYFEKLNHSLVKCTTCKKEIKVSSHLTDCTRIFRAHLLKKHGLSLDDEIRTLPDDLRQCYSELPGYKAKCNNCGKAVSFLTNIENLRVHLRRHSTRILSRDDTSTSTCCVMDPSTERQNQDTSGLPIQSFQETTEKTDTLDETVIMVPKKKRSKFRYYFKNLKPSLAKCRTCKKEIKISHPTARTRIFRVHLFRHNIFLDNDTYTLPDDFKQYYSELPRYKAKCKDCDETLSFLSNMENLRKHLRSRHSTTIQSRDETTPTKKRSNLWNYFEELKPLQIKCTTCKKEMKVSHPTYYTKLMRLHLSRHGIFLDNDTLTLPDDLRQYYSELPEYKAKCNNCGETLSFLTNVGSLRKHLRRHSTSIQSPDETVIMALKRKRNKLWNYFEELKPTLVKCTTCKKEIKISHPSYRIQTFRAHLLNVHGIFLDNDTRTLPDDFKQYYSELPRYKAKCKDCDETLSFLSNMENLREHLRRKHSTTIQSRDETVIMALKRKRSKLWNYFEELKPTLVKCTTCKKEIKISHPSYRIQTFRAHLLNVHGIFLDNDTRTLPDKLRQYYSELPGYKAKCNNCGVTVSFLSSSNLRKHLRSHSTITQSRDEPNTSSSTGRVMDPNAELQSQETINLALQSCEQSRKETRTRDGPSTLSSTAYIMDPSTGKYIPLRQSQEQVPSGLPVQSLKKKGRQYRRT